MAHGGKDGTYGAWREEERAKVERIAQSAESRGHGGKRDELLWKGRRNTNAVNYKEVSSYGAGYY